MSNSIFSDLAALGEKLEGELIIDAHTHTGGLCKWYHLPDSTTPEMILEMDRHGVDKIITFPFSSIPSDYAFGNDTVAEAARAYPDRMVGFACVNPHYHMEIKDELDRCRQMGLRGVKMISHYQLYPPEGPNLIPAFEYANDHSWPVLNHDWGSPAYLDKLASTYTQTCLIIGHYSLAYADVIAKHDNVYQCTCAALNFGEVERLLEIVPSEKIVFGSDFTDLPIAFSMGPILYARISDDDKRNMLGLTAKGILDRWPG